MYRIHKYQRTQERKKYYAAEISRNYSGKQHWIAPSHKQIMSRFFADSLGTLVGFAYVHMFQLVSAFQSGKHFYYAENGCQHKSAEKSELKSAEKIAEIAFGSETVKTPVRPLINTTAAIITITAV